MYVQNNPVLLSDPSGRDWWEDLQDWLQETAQDVAEGRQGFADQYGHDLSLERGSSAEMEIVPSEAYQTGRQFGRYASNLQAVGEQAGGLVLILIGGAGAAGSGTLEVASAGLATPIAVPAGGASIATVAAGFGVAGHGTWQLARNRSDPVKCEAARGAGPSARGERPLASGLPFRSGDIIYRGYDTSEGPVEMMAEVAIEGKTLHLEGVAVYPRGAQRLNVGVRQALAVTKGLRDEAKGLGFERLKITGFRSSGITPDGPSIWTST